MNINAICDGDLEALKKIPKSQITKEFSKICLNHMEKNLEEINHEQLKLIIIYKIK